jgi:hypothetical protein
VENFVAEMVTLFGNMEHCGFPVELAVTVLEDGDVWIGSNATLVDAASLNAFCSRCVRAYSCHFPSALHCVFNGSCVCRISL